MEETKITLWFGDLAVLLLCVEYFEAHDAPLSQYKLFNPRKPENSVFNQWLRDNNIDKIYARAITGNYALLESIKRLRRCGLISLSDNFIPTDAGLAILSHETITRDYHNWPVSVPYGDGQFDFANAHRIDL